ncbi:Alpha-D-kanosaminyltransferase [compost metagenome]
MAHGRKPAGPRLPRRLVAAGALRRKEIESAALRAELEEVYASRTWRWVSGLRALKAAIQSWTRPSRAVVGAKSSYRAKVAYLIPGKGLSGGTAVICQHANRLKARGVEVLLIDVLDDGKTLDWFPDLQVPVIALREAPAELEIAVATGWQTVPFLEQLPVKRRLYFVQSDESRFTDDPRLKARILGTYLGPYEYLTEARWIQRWLREEFGHEATYVPNGLDPTIIHPGEPLSPKGPRLRVLLEGPIAIPFKGMADAFAATRDLDCEVWCVSSHGRPEPGWRCDRFFSAVPMTEMRRIYSSCDVLLKMSRVEGFFGPPMEMMACGGAVVVSQVTGYDEYIVAGDNALVVPPGDVAAAREALQRLIADPELRQRLVANGAKTAAEWRWDETIDVLEGLYRSAAADAVALNRKGP